MRVTNKWPMLDVKMIQTYTKQILCYYEIGGDCLFAQIVQIRDKLQRGKTLDKTEREWYRKNRHLVDFKQTYTAAEEDLIKMWTT